jgi:hypothetical protein
MSTPGLFVGRQYLIACAVVAGVLLVRLSEAAAQTENTAPKFHIAHFEIAGNTLLKGAEMIYVAIGLVF